MPAGALPDLLLSFPVPGMQRYGADTEVAVQILSGQKGQP